jgi:plasmid replication initiation protein
MTDNKKSASISPLPLELIYEPQHKELVRQHWNVTFSRQQKMSVAAKRIMAKVLDQIKDDDFELRPFYQMRIGDIITEAGVAYNAVYKEISAAITELLMVVWTFQSIDNHEWEGRHLLNTSQKVTAGYKNGIITIPLNPALAEYFIDIAHYSTYQLSHYMRLKSWYSMRFFEILSAFKDTGFWEVSIEDYRLLMDCGPVLDKRGQPKKDKDGQVVIKYTNVRDLIVRTTTEALEELADTDVAFTIHSIYEENKGTRGRPKILRMRFELKHKPKTVIPPSWLADATTGPIIARLRSWQVNDRNIALYSEVLTRDGIKKLLREWELKENSSNRINSKAKYCNYAFVQAAKQVLAQKKAEVLQTSLEL